MISNPFIYIMRYSEYLNPGIIFKPQGYKIFKNVKKNKRHSVKVRNIKR